LSKDWKLLSIINYGYYENEDGPIWFCKCRDEKLKPYIIEIQDDELDPIFYILKKDWDFFEKVTKSMYLWHLVKRTDVGIPTYWNEETIAIHTKYPRDVAKLRKYIRSIPYFNADIKWEKMVAQHMQLKQFIEVRNLKKYGFTEMKDIRNTDEVFDVKQNICYWDIETRNDKLSTLKNMWQHPDKFDIISYVTYNPFENTYIYYAWKPEWERLTIKGSYNSVLKKSLLDPDSRIVGHQMMDTYPLESDRIIKHFSNERDMHGQFILDFSESDYDGIMMFNGRGGNIVNKSKGGNRTWRNGFDMPAFYTKCDYLKIKKLLNLLSPVPKSTTWKRPVTTYRTFKDGKSEKFEVHIDCVPQHDIYFDNTIFRFTKDEDQMKDQKLNTYMENFLGVGKLKHTGEMVWEMFDRDWQEEMLYNIIDVEGMFALDMFHGFNEDVMGRALAYGAKIEDVIYGSKLHDHIYLWYANDKYCLDIRGQSRGRWEGFIHKKMGGYNKEIPEEGVLLGYPKEEFGFIIDFSKLYPTCYMSANADIRTKVEFDHYEDSGKTIVDIFGTKYPKKDLCTPPSGFFRKDIVAQNTLIWKDFIKNRTVFADKADDCKILASKSLTKEAYKVHKTREKIYSTKSFSYKNLTNTKFGADGMGDPNSKFKPRTYDLVIYNTPTSMGQEIIIYMLETLLPLYGYEPFFASTDSAMVKARSTTAWDTWEESKKLCKNINRDLGTFIESKYNPIHNYINIGVEKVFNQCILLNKRMYVLKTLIEDTKDGPVMLKKPKIYIRGLECLKSNSSMVTTDVQLQLVKMITDNKTEQEIKNYLENIDSLFETYNWKYISGRASISKNVEDYKTNSQSSNACRNANYFMGKDYKAMARPYLGHFEKVPNELKGIPNTIMYQNKKGNYPIAFEDWDQEWMEKYKFGLDHQKHKELHLISKIERFLTLIWGVDYWDFLEEEVDSCEV